MTKIADKNENAFEYSYSAQQSREAQKIRDQYLPKTENVLDELKRLDRKVKRPATILAYVLGSLSAIIMGSGMSLVMTDIGTTLGMTETVTPGIIIGIVGMVMAVANYPVYKKILAGRKEKYADQIIALSDKLM